MRQISSFIRLQWFLFTLLNLPLLCSAQALEVSPSLNDTAMLEAFVDGVMTTSMAEHHTAGAVVAIVVEGEVRLKKGYGYANVDLKIKVDPDKTLFRIASVTKLFTYLSMMQLYEQGKLDLNANIQDYLPNLVIPETFPSPIRVIDLFTHTAGFEDRIIGLYGKDRTAVRPLEELLGEDLPARVRKPGLVSAYSNHSLGIAGLIIENISGMSWEDYVHHNILEPLGMDHTTAEQPVPEALQQYLSAGYEWQAGKFKPYDFQYIPVGPAGSMSASASDMMKFMLATMNRGQLDGQRIISESNLALMQSRLWTVHPALDAWLYGYAENTINGVRTFGHDGGTSRFYSEFMMMPEQNSGLFISTNSASGYLVNAALVRGLMDRYFPNEHEITRLASPSNLQNIVGEYATYRHAFTTGAKINRVNGTVSIQAGETAGEIRIIGMDGQRTAVEIEPMLFQFQDDFRKLYFDTDEDGQQRLFIGGAFGSYYKLGVMDSTRLHATLLVISVLVMLWALIAWPIQKFTSSRQPSVAEHRSRLAFWWFSLVSLFVLLGILLTASEQIVYGLSTALRFYLALATMIPLLGLLTLVSVLRLLPDDGTESSIKLFHVMTALSAVTLCWLLYYWRFMGLA